MHSGTPANFSGGHCAGVPPLPIPNREVKPGCADGTAMQCGRVGSCLFYAGLDYEGSQGPFVFPGISVQGSLRLHGFRVGGCVRQDGFPFFEWEE